MSTFDRSDRNLFGYKAFIVLSDSMKATDFDAGDLVLAKYDAGAAVNEGANGAERTEIGGGNKLRHHTYGVNTEKP